MEISAELKGQFLRLYHMAASDGEFSKTELIMLYKYAAEKGVSKEELDSILLNPIGVIEIPSLIQTKIEFLYDLANMMWADGEVVEDEENTLKKFIKSFGFMEENVPEMTKFFIQSIRDKVTKEDIISQLV